MARFTLNRGRWYGWSMYPGYVGPYFSPIRITGLAPLGSGKSLMQVDFFNACYAEGVQMFSLPMKILYRAPDHMLAALLYQDDTPPERTAVISELTWDWLTNCLPAHTLDKRFATAEAAVAHFFRNVHF